MVLEVARAAETAGGVTRQRDHPGRPGVGGGAREPGSRRVSARECGPVSGEGVSAVTLSRSTSPPPLRRRR